MAMLLLRGLLMGKGSKRRPEDKKKIDANWNKIFGDKNANKTKEKSKSKK